MKRETKIGISILFLLSLIAFFVWREVLFFSEDAALKVIFFDVGEGDCALIEMPKSIQVIIDGGPSKSVVSKIVSNMPFFDRKIELVILTHPDKDHITGLFEIFDTFEVEKVLMPEIKGSESEKSLYLKFKEAVEKEKSQLIFAKQGQKISFPGDIYFLVFWPQKDFVSNETNDFSLVGKLIFGKVSFLFTGDISSKIETQLANENLNLESSVLKVSHHGSKYSTSSNFLEKVKPLIAVISVGKNNYGHPSREVLERLEKFGIKTLTTEKNGDIKIKTNGSELIIK